MDAVLWPSTRPLPDGERPAAASKVHVQLADVATTRGVHHRERLVAALGALLEALEYRA